MNSIFTGCSDIMALYQIYALKTVIDIPTRLLAVSLSLVNSLKKIIDMSLVLTGCSDILALCQTKLFFINYCNYTN